MGFTLQLSCRSVVTHTATVTMNFLTTALLLASVLLLTVEGKFKPDTCEETCDEITNANVEGAALGREFLDDCVNICKINVELAPEECSKAVNFMKMNICSDENVLDEATELCMKEAREVLKDVRGL